MTDHGAVAGLLDQDEALHLEGAAVFSGRGFMQVLPESIHVIYHWDDAGKFTYEPGRLRAKDRTITRSHVRIPLTARDTTATRSAAQANSFMKFAWGDVTFVPSRITVSANPTLVQSSDATASRVHARVLNASILYLRFEDVSQTRAIAYVNHRAPLTGTIFISWNDVSGSVDSYQLERETWGGELFGGPANPNDPWE